MIKGILEEGDFILEEEMLDKEDQPLILSFRKYKNYTTIRRNLREAYQLINFAIMFQNTIMDKNMEENKRKELIENNEKIAKTYFYYSIVLYSKWFKNTKGKPCLKEDEYFKEEAQKYLKSHTNIVKLRDKYIAHNELDLLGGDQVIINTKDIENITVGSNWIEQCIPDEHELLEFQKCIQLIHNIIDAEVIPKYERRLVGNLNQRKSIIKSLVNR